MRAAESSLIRPRCLLALWGVVALVLVTAVPAAAAPGDLDPAFGTGGKVTTDFNSGFEEAFGVAVQDDGKIVAAGRVLNGVSTSSCNDFALARYNRHGTLDRTFGTDGKVITDFDLGCDVARSVAVQADGKIVVAGWASPGTSFEFALARYSPDGTLDPTFGSGGKVLTDFAGGTDLALAVAVQPDAKIVAAGSASLGGSLDFALARYNPDGTLDSTFGSDGRVTTDYATCDDQAAGILLQAEGKIVAAGTADMCGGSFTFDFALARYNADGTLDPAFGSGGKVTTHFGADDDAAQDVDLQADGRIVATGVAEAADGFSDFALARYNADGTLDPGFGSGGTVLTDFASRNDDARAAVILPDGKIVAVGSAFTGSSVDFALARYESDGTLDQDFGLGGKVTTDFASGEDVASDAALQEDGKVVAAGQARIEFNTDFALARYLGERGRRPNGSPGQQG
jgi:uncharacterized delta-60 repeat protein